MALQLESHWPTGQQHSLMQNPQQALENELMNPNAYKNAAGLLMQVMGDVTQEEMKLNMANAAMNAQAVTVQAGAAEGQAEASVEGAEAQAIGSGVSAGIELTQAGLTANNSRQQQANYNNYQETTKTINDPNGSSTITARGGQVPNPERDLSDAKVEYEHKQKALESTQQVYQTLGQLGTQMARDGSQIAGSLTSAAGSLRQNEAQMAQQLESQLNNNQQTESSVLQTLFSINPAAVALAAARG